MCSMHKLPPLATRMFLASRKLLAQAVVPQRALITTLATSGACRVEWLEAVPCPSNLILEVHYGHVVVHMPRS